MEMETVSKSQDDLIDFPGISNVVTLRPLKDGRIAVYEFINVDSQPSLE